MSPRIILRDRADGFRLQVGLRCRGKACNVPIADGVQVHGYSARRVASF